MVFGRGGLSETSWKYFLRFSIFQHTTLTNMHNHVIMLIISYRSGIESTVTLLIVLSVIKIEQMGARLYLMEHRPETWSTSIEMKALSVS